MNQLHVVLRIIDGCWLEAVVQEWRDMAERGEMPPDCDRWAAAPSERQTWEDCKDELKVIVTEVLAEHGSYLPIFYDMTPDWLDAGLIAMVNEKGDGATIVPVRPNMASQRHIEMLREAKAKRGK